MPPIEVHVWPGNWGLLSIDVECLAVVSLFQLLLPGSFTVHECVDAQISSDEQLPFVKDGPRIIAKADIPQYISQKVIKKVKDGNSQQDVQELTTKQNAESEAYIALTSDKVLDLVYHTMFSLPQNYLNVTRHAIAASLPPPNKWIYPARLRSSAQVKNRLVEKELWGLGGDADFLEKQERNRKMGTDEFEYVKEKNMQEKQATRTAAKNVFEQEKIVKFARATIEPFASKLGQNQFFYGSRPSTLDAIVYSHFIFFLLPEFPQPIIKSLLESDYPQLYQHILNMHSLLYPNEEQAKQQNILSRQIPQIVTLPPPSSSVLSLPQNVLSTLYTTIAPKQIIRNLMPKQSSRSNENSKLQHKILWGLGVSVAFTTFLFVNGITVFPNFSDLQINEAEIDEDDELEFLAE